MERKGEKQKKNNILCHHRISCEFEGLYFSFPFQPHLETNVMSRGLVVENPKTRDIIKFHSSYYKNTTEVNFEGEVLVYVTPVSRKKRIIKKRRSYTAVNFCPSTISWPLNQVSQRSRFSNQLPQSPQGVLLPRTKTLFLFITQEKVSSSCPGQADFPPGQLSNFKIHLCNGQGSISRSSSN